MEGIQKLVTNIAESAKMQENPANRTVRRIDVKLNSDVQGIDQWDVFITSDCDGWAEDADKKIGTFVAKPSGALINSLIGKSEEALITAFSVLEDVETCLCPVLNELFTRDGLFVQGYEEGDENIYADTTSPLGDLAERLACGFLIADNGQCNWENIIKVREAGYRVFPGDQDSFGWLVGCIGKGNKILCYG